MNGTRDEARERALEEFVRNEAGMPNDHCTVTAAWNAAWAAGERAGLELAAQRCEKEQSSVGDAYAKAIRALAVEGEQK